MTALVHAEIRKLFATRSWRALFAAPVVYPLLVVALAALSPAAHAGMSTTVIARGGADVARFAALVLGILAVAGEHRHGTIVPTLLAAPRRNAFVLAKLASQAGVGAAMGAASTAVALTAGAVHLASKGVHVDLISGDVALVAAGVVLVGVFYATAGAALGAIVRNQTAAISGALLWLLAVEEALPLVLRNPGVRRWLPGGAAARLLHLGDPVAGTASAAAAAALLAAVAAVLVGVALAVTTRTDID